MATYVRLVKFSGEGIDTLNDWEARVARGREAAERNGNRVHHVYLTLGEYDAVVIMEFKDDAAALQDSIEYAMSGRGKTMTLRAFTEQESAEVVSRLREA